MKLLTSLFLLVLVTASGLAQVEHKARFEVDHTWSSDDYLVIPNQEKGLLLVQPKTIGPAREFPIFFEHLDKNLQSTWSDSISISKKYYLKGYHAENGVSFLLFQNRTNNLYIKIVTVDPFNNEIKEFEPKEIVDLEIFEFEVLKNTAVLGGYIDNRPAVFAYDMENDKVRTLSNVFQNNSELVEVKINQDSVTFNVVSSTFDQKKDRTFIINTYDYAGNAIRDYQLETQPLHNLLTGVSSSINDKEQVVVGLYAVKTGTFPSGLFINHVDKTGRQTMTYKNFGEFETFLDHNGEKKSLKFKDKALAAKSNGREWRYKIDALFKELIEEDGKYILTGEFYRPWSMSTSNYLRQKNLATPLSFANGPFFYDPARQIERRANDFRGTGVPLEFNFTHAFALVLDRKGNVLWDGSFDIKEQVDAPLAFFGEFQWDKDNAYYAFYHDEEFVIKNLNDREITEGLKRELDLRSPDDQLRYERDAFKGVSRWYDNHYLIHGIQHIRNKTLDTPLRRVFFINSISVGPKLVPEQED